ncbi:16751_t:CDS:2, partial [Acaulospora morrowiae]
FDLIPLNPTVVTICYCLFSKIYEYNPTTRDKVKQRIKDTFIFSGPFLWVAVPVVYTYFTFREMGDIPFGCPPNYNYTTPAVRSACNIRTVNLVCYKKLDEQTSSEEAASSEGRGEGYNFSSDNEYRKAMMEILNTDQKL